MNLKFFHFVFIIASAIVAFMFAGWEICNGLATKHSSYYVGAAIAGVIGIALIIYGIRFRKKAKKIIT